MPTLPSTYLAASHPGKLDHATLVAFTVSGVLQAGWATSPFRRVRGKPARCVALARARRCRPTSPSCARWPSFVPSTPRTACKLLPDRVSSGSFALHTLRPLPCCSACTRRWETTDVVCPVTSRDAGLGWA